MPMLFDYSGPTWLILGNWKQKFAYSWLCVHSKRVVLGILLPHFTIEIKWRKPVYYIFTI